MDVGLVALASIVAMVAVVAMDAMAAMAFLFLLLLLLILWLVLLIIKFNTFKFPIIKSSNLQITKSSNGAMVAVVAMVIIASTDTFMIYHFEKSEVRAFVQNVYLL